MSRNLTQIVYRDGTFHEEPAPAWLLEALDVAKGGLHWHKALSQVLETEGCPFGAEALEGSAIEIMLWRSKTLGVYVEIRDCVAYWDDIWVPRAGDWWPFQAGYLLPFITSAGNLAVAHELKRIGNALIAYGRYGEGKHITRDYGEAAYDLRRDREESALHRAGA